MRLTRKDDRTHKSNTLMGEFGYFYQLSILIVLVFITLIIFLIDFQFFMK